MEKVEIRYYFDETLQSDHGIKIHVVKGPRNRYVGDFPSIAEALRYAKDNGFEVIDVRRIK